MEELKKLVEEGQRILDLIISANMLFEHKEALMIEDLQKLLLIGGLIHNEYEELEKISNNLNADSLITNPYIAMYGLKLFDEFKELKNKREYQYRKLMKNLEDLPNLIAV